ncbi:hypothetical protein CHARACLAT_032499 [Characodon lateralis]|uniref:Uncharacterized protein n=1 Tax=Characodon lateralis TaxID=208331 RepID=A0ABU7DEL0_9TELE|nr:hypothetical protein [Characodon lateralis]
MMKLLCFISKTESSHPTQESHFGCLYSGSRSFGHDPYPRTIVEGRECRWTSKSRASPFSSTSAALQQNNETPSRLQMKLILKTNLSDVVIMNLQILFNINI